MAKSRGWLAAIGLVSVVVMGCSDTSTAGTLVIRSAPEYQDANKLAAALVDPVFPKLDRGEDLTSQDKEALQKAAQLYDGMSAFRPTNPSTDFAAGHAYEALGEHETAAAKFRQFLTAVGDNPKGDVRVMVADAHGMMSRALFGKKDFKGALTEATTALTMYPGTVDYLVDRASASTQLGDSKSAKADVKLALQTEPTNRRAQGLALLLGVK